MAKIDNEDKIIWDDEARPPEPAENFSTTGGWLGAMPAILMGIFCLGILGVIARAVYIASGSWLYVALIFVGGIAAALTVIWEVVR